MSNEWKYPTLEQCKRLVELGVVLETEKYWLFDVISEKWVLKRKDELFKSHLHGMKDQFHIHPAPDVAELGVMLDGYNVIKGKNAPHYKLFESDWNVLNGFLCLGSLPEAQARCAALIWLIENKYLESEDIKLCLNTTQSRNATLGARTTTGWYTSVQKSTESTINRKDALKVCLFQAHLFCRIDGRSKKQSRRF